MRVRPLVFALVIVALSALLWLARRPERAASHPRPEATPAPTPNGLPTSPEPSPTPGPEPPAVRHRSFTFRFESEPTPSPPPPPTKRPPTPTPRLSECIVLRHSAEVLPGTLGRILVEVYAKNECGRDLAPLEVWFWVGGYRHGDLVQSVQGHPFDPILRGDEGKAAIVLPGSIDWYDRIEVRVVQANWP